MVLTSVMNQEEDPVAMAYGIPIEGEGDSRCLALLNVVQEAVGRQLRGSKGSSSSRRTVFEGIPAVVNSLQITVVAKCTW